MKTNPVLLLQYGNEYRFIDGIFEAISPVQRWDGKCNGKFIL